MAVEHGYGRIVTDGLVLCLDAADKNSYPGSGNTWYDLSGQGNNGILKNGVGYSSDNNGTLIFDGTNDYVEFINSSFLCNIFNGSTNFSIIVTFNVISGSYLLDIGNIGSDPTGGMEFRTTSIRRNNTSGGTSSLSASLLPSNWNIIGFTRSSSLVHDWYLNGVFSNSTQATETYSVNQLVKIGRRALNTSGIFKGSISSITVYNRVLTPQEIQQNYNATKTRFGL